MPAWAPAPDWQALYIAAKASVSLLERFSTYRLLHPVQQVAVGDSMMAYTASGAGAPILLLPDGDRPADFFWRLIECLERRMRVIAVDYPAGACAADLLAGVQAVMRHEGIGAASVLGFGFGGLLAQCLADTEPACVRALTLVNAPTPIMAKADGYHRQAKAAQSAWGFGFRRRARRAFLKGLACPAEDKGFWRGYEREWFGQRWSKSAAAALLRAQADLHAGGGQCPSSLRIPVLIVETEGVPPNLQPALRRTPARFPLAERRTFAPGAGRTIEITRPRELTRWIDQQRASLENV